MFTKKAFKYVLNFWFSLFLSIAMSLTMTYVNTGFVPFPGVIIPILEGTAIAYIAGVILPINKWGDAFAALCKATKGMFLFTLISTFVVTLYFTIIMTTMFTAMAIGFPSYFLLAVLGSFPISFGVAYLVALIITPLAFKLTNMMTNKPMEVI